MVYDPYNSTHEANLIKTEQNMRLTDITPNGPKAPRRRLLLTPLRRREAASAYDNAIVAPFSK